MNNHRRTVANDNKHKNARNLVLFKVKRLKREYYQSYFQKQ